MERAKKTSALDYLAPNMVGMSKERLFNMWRNYEFSNFHATYSNLFFEVQNWDSQDSAETAAHIT